MQKEVYLSKEQRKEISDFANKGSHSAQLIKRARVLLALDRSNKKDHQRITSENKRSGRFIKASDLQYLR